MFAAFVSECVCGRVRGGGGGGGGGGKPEFAKYGRKELRETNGILSRSVQSVQSVQYLFAQFHSPNDAQIKTHKRLT